MSDSARVHGMDGSLVVPDWPPLSLAELREILGSYAEPGEPLDITFHSPRPLSAAAVVPTSRGDYFVKRHARSVRDRAGLLEEHYFLSHLRAHGAAAPRVLVNVNGNSAIEAGDWTYEVHEIAAGMDIYADAVSWTPFLCVEHASQAGKALAGLHRAAEGFDAPRRKPQPLVASFTIFGARDAFAELRKYLKARRALAEHAGVWRCAGEALEALAPYHAELLPSLSQLNQLWTHNDLHASNLFWSDAGVDTRVASIIDFGLADRTNAVHDLAHAIERNIVDWLSLVRHPKKPEDVLVHFDHLEALLDGYESVRPLSDEEAAALAPMTALCHAEFALSEADYFLGALHSEENAKRAYDGWLLGHALWFNRQRGRALLDAIRRWADTRKMANPGVMPR